MASSMATQLRLGQPVPELRLEQQLASTSTAATAQTVQPETTTHTTSATSTSSATAANSSAAFTDEFFNPDEPAVYDATGSRILFRTNAQLFITEKDRPILQMRGLPFRATAADIREFLGPEHTAQLLSTSPAPAGWSSGDNLLKPLSSAAAAGGRGATADVETNAASETTKEIKFKTADANNKIPPFLLESVKPRAVSVTTADEEASAGQGDEKSKVLTIGKNTTNSTTSPDTDSNSIELVYDYSGRPSGFARLYFKTHEAAQKCRRDLHGKRMMRRYVELFYYRETAKVGTADEQVGGGAGAITTGTGYGGRCARVEQSSANYILGTKGNSTDHRTGTRSQAEGWPMHPAAANPACILGQQMGYGGAAAAGAEVTAGRNNTRMTKWNRTAGGRPGSGRVDNGFAYGGWAGMAGGTGAWSQPEMASRLAARAAQTNNTSYNYGYHCGNKNKGCDYSGRGAGRQSWWKTPSAIAGTNNQGQVEQNDPANRTSTHIDRPKGAVGHYGQKKSGNAPGDGSSCSAATTGPSSSPNATSGSAGPGSSAGTASSSARISSSPTSTSTVTCRASSATTSSSPAMASDFGASGVGVSAEALATAQSRQALFQYYYEHYYAAMRAARVGPVISAVGGAAAAAPVCGYPTNYQPPGLSCCPSAVAAGVMPGVTGAGAGQLVMTGNGIAMMVPQQQLPVVCPTMLAPVMPTNPMQTIDSSIVMSGVWAPVPDASSMM